MKVKNGKPLEKLGLLDAFDLYDRYALDSGKWAAMHPAVDERLLYDEPEGYVLGKYQDKYVCVSFDLPGATNVYINGGSGTQKTSAAGIIASALIANDPENESNVRQLILDPKGEIHDIASFPGDGTFHISPSDRTMYGYDPFFRLKEDSSEQEVFETAHVVAISIIPREKGETDPIWRNSSRAMLISFIIYGWTKKGFRNLAQVFNWSMSATPQELVAEVVENSSPSSTAFKLVIAYYGNKAPDDMVGSIYGTLVSRIEIGILMILLLYMVYHR